MGGSDYRESRCSREYFDYTIVCHFSYKKEMWIENIIEEIMAKNFPNLKEKDTKIQEAQRAQTS